MHMGDPLSKVEACRIQKRLTSTWDLGYSLTARWEDKKVHMGGPPSTEKASRRLVYRGGASEYRGGPLNGGETKHTQEAPVHMGDPPCI